MRLFVALFFVLSIQFNSFTQISWTELPAHNQSDVELVFVSNEGHLIGYLDIHNKLMISEDLGQTWDVFYEGSLLENKPSHYSFIKQNDQNDYFLVFDEVVFKYDITDKSLGEFINLGTHIDDFCILPNGNIVVAEGRSISLYSPTGSAINSVGWWTHSAQFLPGPNDVHYVSNSLGASKFMVRFNSDLSEVSAAEPAPRNTNNPYLFHNGRLFSENDYSDDGINWFSYNDVGRLHNITSLSNGLVIALSNSNVYVSSNNGDSFQEHSLGISQTNKIFNHLSDGIIFANTKCSISEIKYTPKELTALVDISTNFKIGLPFASSVEAGFENNVFVANCSSYEYFTTSSNSTWKSLTLDSNDVSCFFLYGLQCLSNGNVISVDGCISSDEGHHWTNTSTIPPVSPTPIQVKNDVIYLLDNFFNERSFDFGLSWEPYDIIDETVLVDYILGVTSSGSIVYAAFNHLFNLEVWLQKESGEAYMLDIDYSGIWGGLETSYNGNNIYYLPGVAPQNHLELQYSYDNGKNFNSTYLIDFVHGSRNYIYVDHLENIFVYSDKMIWMSQDEAQTWTDITPTFANLFTINDVDVGFDNHVYLATSGTGILKSAAPIDAVKRLNVFLFEDQNNNCDYDISERPIANQIIEVDNTIQRPTNDLGLASMQLFGETHTVKARFRDDLYESCNNEQIVQFDSLTDELSVFIPVSIKESCADLSLGVSNPFLRRCFENSYQVEIRNEGTVAAENTVLRVTMDEYFDYIDSDFTLLSIDNLDYYFDLGNVEAGSLIRGKIYFTLSCDAALGQSHYVTSVVQFDNPCDSLQEESDAFECKTNIGSYDPNDKSIFINGFANKTIIGDNDEVEYLIRFQNTGTDTAFNVRVTDNFANPLFLESFEVSAASHDYSWSINRRKLSVEFNNIKLVDSTTNEKESHGFVKFRIKLSDNLEPGSIVRNAAQIYFDFNEPILTEPVSAFYLCQNSYYSVSDTICAGEYYENYNISGFYIDEFQSTFGCDSIRHLRLIVLDSTHTLCKSTSSVEQLHDQDIKFYPNPFYEVLTLEHLNLNGASIEIFNLYGKKVASTRSLVNHKSLNLSHLVSGCYIVQLHTTDGKHYSKKIIKH